MTLREVLRSLISEKVDRVSTVWLEQQRRSGDRHGVDGVSWSWPVNKIANETPWRHRQPRKRA